MSPETVPPGMPGGPEFFPPDDDDDDDDEPVQAEIGTLFALQGPEYREVNWSIHRVRTREEIARDPKGKREGWVADAQGELNGADLVQRIGGGTFHFLGYVAAARGGGVRLKFNEWITLEGPRKDFSAPTPEPKPPAALAAEMAHPVSATDRLLRMLIRRDMEQAARFEKFMESVATARAQAPAPAAQPTIVELVTALKGLKEISAAPPAPVPVIDKSGDPVPMMRLLIDTMNQGILLGQTREPVAADAEPANNVMPVVEKALDIFGTMMRERAARRPVHPGGPPPPPRPASGATVVDPPPAPEPTPPPALEPRWDTAIRALYRAQVNGTDPADFAATLEAILDPAEVEQLAASTPEAVLGMLAPVLPQYPALATESGKVYLGEVLAALRAGTDEEDTTTPDESSAMPLDNVDSTEEDV
jgi:hypothetical protein